MYIYKCIYIGIYIYVYIYFSFLIRIQTIGLGGMKPNTVIVGWPYSWRQENKQSWRTFIQTVRTVAACHMALLVPKGINFYPESSHKVHLFHFITYNISSFRMFI